MKMLMAVIVVCIHITSEFNYSKEFPYLYFFELAVPSFFVASGFFLQNNFFKKDVLSVCRKQFVRVFKMYAFWALIFVLGYFFIDVVTGFFSVADIKSVMLKVLFSGNNLPYAVQLWYVYSLMLSILVIWGWKKMNLRILWLWVLSIILYCLRTNIEGVFAIEAPVFLKKIVALYIYLYHDHKSFLFEGLACVTSGMLIREYLYDSISSNKRFISGVGIIIVSMFASVYIPVKLYPLLSAVGFFMVFVSMKLEDNPLYPKLRRLSTLVYLLHLWTLYAVKKYVCPYLSFDPVLVYPLVIISSLFVAWLYMKIISTERFRWLRQFS